MLIQTTSYWFICHQYLWIHTVSCEVNVLWSHIVYSFRMFLCLFAGLLNPQLPTVSSLRNECLKALCICTYEKWACCLWVKSVNNLQCCVIRLLSTRLQKSLETLNCTCFVTIQSNLNVKPGQEVDGQSVVVLWYGWFRIWYCLWILGMFMLL